MNLVWVKYQSLVLCAIAALALTMLVGAVAFYLMPRTAQPLVVQGRKVSPQQQVASPPPMMGLPDPQTRAAPNSEFAEEFSAYQRLYYSIYRRSPVHDTTFPEVDRSGGCILPVRRLGPTGPRKPDEPFPDIAYFAIILNPPKRSPVEQDIWEYMKAFQRLRGVSAAGRGVTDEDIRPIAGHPQLRYLNLAGTNVHWQQCLEIVASTSKLRWLVVSDDMLTPEDAAAFREKFAHVVLDVVPRTRTPTAPPKQFGRPREFQFSDNGMEIPGWLRAEFLADKEYEEDDLDQFVQMRLSGSSESMAWPHVTMAEFCGQPIADADLGRLLGPMKLVYLGIANTQVTSAGLMATPNLSSLRILHVDEPLLTDECIERLQKLEHLRWITVDRGAVLAVDERKLQEALPNVTLRYRLYREAMIESSDANSELPEWATEVPLVAMLKAFHFPTAFTVTEINRKQLASIPHIPNITTIRWAPGLPVDDDALVALGEITSLKSLVLDERLTARSFGPLSRLKNLDTARLSCDGLDAERAAELCRTIATIPRLRELHLGPGTLSEEAVAELVKCGSLRILTLAPNTNATTSEEALFARLMQLTLLKGRAEFQRPKQQFQHPNP